MNERSATGFKRALTAFGVMLALSVGVAIASDTSSHLTYSIDSGLVEQQSRIEREIRDSLAHWGFSPTFTERFLLAAPAWNVKGVAVHLDFLDRAGVSAPERENFTKLVLQYRPADTRPPAASGPSNPPDQRSHLPIATIKEAFLSSDSRFDCRPYLTDIRVSGHSDIQLRAPTTYGASGFPTAGADFLALGSGDVFAPGEFGDIDVGVGGCDDDNVSVTFQFNNDIPAGGPIEVQSIKFDFYAFSYEIPDFVGSGVNDYAFAYLDTPDPIPLLPFSCDAPVVPAQGCLVTRDQFGNPTNVDSAFYDLCSVQPCDMPSGTPGWHNTFDFTPGDDAGSTGRLEACTPLSPSCAAPATAGTHTLTLIVGDAGDGIFTTVGLFDNLRCFSDLQCNGPVIQEPPTCNPGGPYSGTCRTVVVNGATVLDPEGDDVDYTWSSTDPNISFSVPNGTIVGGVGPIPATNVILGSGVLPCGYTATIRLSVTDGQNPTFCETTVTFDDDIDPTFNAPLPGPIDISCSDPLPTPAALTAGDNCDTSVIVSVVTGPLVGGQCNGTYTRTWTATDDCGNTATHTQIISVHDAVDPIFDQPLPGDITINCSTPLPAAPTVTATDNCDMSVTVTVATGALQGDSCNGTILRTWTATDDCGNDITHTQTITVHDGIDPIFDQPLPGDISVSCSTPLPAAPTVTATDNCDTNVTVTVATGALQGDNCNGTILRTWTATDDCGNDITHTQTITVHDGVDPIFDQPLPGDISVSCSTPLPAAPTVTATDNCDPSVTVTVATGTLQGDNCNGTILRTWTATDDCGNDITHTQTITVHDGVDPIFDQPLPGDISVSCSTPLPAAPTVTATDNCDPSVTVTVATGTLQGDNCNGTILRTWTATDDCGNDITHTQTITVHDDVDPVFDTPLPGPITVACVTEVPPADPVTATDNCDTSVDVAAVLGPLVGDSCNGTITRTWTATDDCGNDITHSQTITVHDDVDPVFGGALPGPITVSCATEIPPAETLAATDNCDTSVDVVAAAGPLVGDSCNGTVTRTWTATDDCGNQLVHTQVITVHDDVDPEATAILVPAPAAPPTSPASPASPSSVCSTASSHARFQVVCGATDNCDANPTTTAVLVVTNTTVGGQGECVVMTEEIPVTCGQEIEIQLAAPPCPASSPQSSQPAQGSTSDGVLVVTGESVVLMVTATDACGNTGTAIFDATTLPADCGEGETCCPVIGPPEPGSCGVENCPGPAPVTGPPGTSVAAGTGQRK